MEQKIKNMVGYQESESEIKTIVSNSNVQANDTVKRLPVSTTNRIQSQTSNTKFSYGNGENQVTDNQSVNQSNVTRVTTQDARTDQLFTIIEKLEASADIGPEKAAPLALGVKLFGSLMLANRKNDLFINLFPHFSSFMKKLKQKT